MARRSVSMRDMLVLYRLAGMCLRSWSNPSMRFWTLFLRFGGLFCGWLVVERELESDEEHRRVVRAPEEGSDGEAASEGSVEVVDIVDNVMNAKKKSLPLTSESDRSAPVSKLPSCFSFQFLLRKFGFRFYCLLTKWSLASLRRRASRRPGIPGVTVRPGPEGVYASPRPGYGVICVSDGPVVRGPLGLAIIPNYGRCVQSRGDRKLREPSGEREQLTLNNDILEGPLCRNKLEG